MVLSLPERRRWCEDSSTLSPRILRAPLLPDQGRLQAHTDEEHKMEEGNENGKFLHAVKLGDNLLLLYHSSNLNESIYRLLFNLPPFHRLVHNVTWY